MHSFLKKISGISISIPAPSPVLPSELTAPLCSRQVNIFNALEIISLVFFPSKLHINPAPQFSCSNNGLYRPCSFKTQITGNQLIYLLINSIEINMNQ